MSPVRLSPITESEEVSNLPGFWDTTDLDHPMIAAPSSTTPPQIAIGTRFESSFMMAASVSYYFNPDASDPALYCIFLMLLYFSPSPVALN